MIPAGATSLTVQALSQDSGVGPFAGNLPASLVWLASGLALESPLPPERPHPGWNWVDVGIMLTKNQPAYWSALTGQPGPGGAAVSRFTILDPTLYKYLVRTLHIAIKNYTSLFIQQGSCVFRMLNPYKLRKISMLYFE